MTDQTLGTASYAIRAGETSEIDASVGEWVYVDPGFASSKSKSCGLLVGDGTPSLHTFDALRRELVDLACTSGPPLNLVIEAPLSVAFSSEGNPVGRAVERRDKEIRYWYQGLGCVVLMSATYLLRAITDSRLAREIRLFEGLVTFKSKGQLSDHRRDVMRLREVVRGTPGAGRVVAPPELLRLQSDNLRSAFAVSGMDYGLPPIIDACPPAASPP